MRKLALLVVCVGSAAFAGEVLIGTLIVTDGGQTTNRTVGRLNATGTALQTFEVPLAKITIQCDQASQCLTDVQGCDAGVCMRLAADEKFPTSVNTAKTFTAKAWTWDGGSQALASNPTVTYTGGWVSCGPVTGGEVSYCRVYSRTGNE